MLFLRLFSVMDGMHAHRDCQFSFSAEALLNSIVNRHAAIDSFKCLFFSFSFLPKAALAEVMNALKHIRCHSGPCKEPFLEDNKPNPVHLKRSVGGSNSMC